MSLKIKNKKNKKTRKRINKSIEIVMNEIFFSLANEDHDDDDEFVVTAAQLGS